MICEKCGGEFDVAEDYDECKKHGALCDECCVQAECDNPCSSEEQG